MKDNNTDNHKYVFVCGLPRSGTSVLGRNVARLEKCTGLTNTGVLEDEGMYLQDVYPVPYKCGGDGRFGFHPRMHVTEKSELLTPENVEKLHKSWEPYWDKNKAILVEKTPSNLVRTRFLQAAFPNSYFVVVKRHPVPVSIAIQKWKVNVTSLYNLFEHWLQCYWLFDEDKPHLKRVYELSYEDYVEDPARYHQEIANFIGTTVPVSGTSDNFRVVPQWRKPEGIRVPERSMEGTSGAFNKKYFDRWQDMLTRSPFRTYYRYIALKYEADFESHGYSLVKGFALDESLDINATKPSRLLGKVYCHGADAWAFCQRFGTRFDWHVRQILKAVLPEFILNKFRRARDARNKRLAAGKSVSDAQKIRVSSA